MCDLGECSADGEGGEVNCKLCPLGGVECVVCSARLYLIPRTIGRGIPDLDPVVLEVQRGELW